MDTQAGGRLLEVDNLSISFRLDDEVVEAVRNVSFHVDRGEMLALVGESGAGKSVTARALMKLLPRTATIGKESRINFAGTRIDAFSERQMLSLRGDRITMIFQEPMSTLNPVYRINTQISESLIRHQGLTKRQARARALDLLKEVRIPDPEARLEQYPHQLSGGQRQRVMIAMALACEPTLLLADEPTTALDVTIQAQILGLLRELQERLAMSILLITHDLGLVAENAQSVLVMYAGRIVETAPVGELFARPKHPYTRGLLGSIPRPRSSAQGVRPARLRTIEGIIPDMRSLPPGCRFADRCSLRVEMCTREEPSLGEVASGRFSRCWRADEL